MFKTILISLILMLSSVTSASNTNTSVEIGTTISHTYNIRVITMPGQVKKIGMAKATVKPAEGYKWNKDFPASFEFMHYETAIATLLEQKAYFKEGELCVPYTGKLVGRVPIVVAVSFSICNAQECLTYRDKKVILSLIVK